MQAEPQPSSPDRLGGGPRVVIFVRHVPEAFIRDLAAFGERAVGLEHAHDRLERIPVLGSPPALRGITS